MIETKAIIITDTLKKDIPQTIIKSPCDCDRRDWLRNKIISEFIKSLDKFLCQNALPDEIEILLKK